MVVHQLRANEVSRLWKEMENHPTWTCALLTLRLSAGFILEVAPAGRGSTIIERRGVTPFLFV